MIGVVHGCDTPRNTDTQEDVNSVTSGHVANARIRVFILACCYFARECIWNKSTTIKHTFIYISIDFSPFRILELKKIDIVWGFVESFVVRLSKPVVESSVQTLASSSREICILNEFLEYQELLSQPSISLSSFSLRHKTLPTFMLSVSSPSKSYPRLAPSFRDL